MTSPRVGIGYNVPLRLAMRIADDAASYCRPVWILDSSSEDIALAAKLLARLGDVVDLAGKEHAAAIVAIRESGLDALVNFTDERIDFLAQAADELRITSEGPGVARCFADKLAQRSRLKEAGIPAPPFAAVDLDMDADALADAADMVGFPAILKPRRANGSLLVRRVDSADQLEQLVRSIDVRAFPAARHGLLLEGYLSDASDGDQRFDDLVSVEMVVANGRATPVALSGRRRLTPPFRECGLFIPAALSPGTVADLEELATAVASAFEVRRSVLHIEVKRTPEGPRVIEVNGRPGGTVPDVLERAGADFSLTEIALRLALGDRLPDVSDLVLSSVGYHMVWQPPVQARAVRSVRGLEEASALPGVTEVQLNRGPGSRVDWRQGFGEFVFYVAGSAPDHDRMMEVVERIDREVVVEYEA